MQLWVGSVDMSWGVMNEKNVTSLSDFRGDRLSFASSVLEIPNLKFGGVVYIMF